MAGGWPSSDASTGVYTSLACAQRRGALWASVRAAEGEGAFMRIPQAGPGCPLASPDASLTKSLECGYVFPPAMFLWLVGVQRTLGTRSWGAAVELCLSWRCVKTGSVH